MAKRKRLPKYALEHTCEGDGWTSTLRLFLCEKADKIIKKYLRLLKLQKQEDIEQAKIINLQEQYKTQSKWAERII